MPPNDPYYNQPAASAPPPGFPPAKPRLRLGVALLICLILLVASLAFGVWAYGQMRDYKNHSDQKAAAAVQQATAAQKQQLRGPICPSFGITLQDL